ncbi:MAG: endonuclease/exonuclease/phosphatase family protein [Marmoricola sp.]
MSAVTGYQQTVRVVTFNILNGRRPVDDVVDLVAFGEALASLEPDVLALQEVDRNQDRSHRADLTAVAADAIGAVDHRFVAALRGGPGATWVAATGEEHPQDAAYGIALLSRHPVSAWHVVRLPVVRVHGPMWHRGKRHPSLVRDEPRVAVAATVQGPGGPLTVANTHLSFLPWWNGRQLRFLERSLRGTGHPLLLAGDLNMGVARATRTTGMRELISAPTFPWDEPERQLDHLLADGPCRVRGGGAVRLPISDHRALVVDLDGHRRTA